MRRAWFAALVAAVSICATLTSPGASAQPYPSQTIRIEVPTPPGGMADIAARVFSQSVTMKTGIPVIAEGKTGAGGIMAADFVAKAVPDGYTLYMGYHATQSMFQHYDRKLPYDPATDFAPVSLLVEGPNVLIINPDVPAHTLPELIAYIRAHPGGFSFASAGLGTVSHLLGEQFQLSTGTHMAHVPYRGAAPAAQDVLAGHVPMYFDLLGLSLENIRAGKLRALAVLTAERLPSLPDVPTMKELGYPEFQGGVWFGLLAPAKTPRPIIDWLNKAATEAFSTPEVQKIFLDQGNRIPLGTPEDFAAYIARETQRWGDIIRKTGVKVE